MGEEISRLLEEFDEEGPAQRWNRINQASDVNCELSARNGVLVLRCRGVDLLYEPSHTRRFKMKWEIPRAIEFRFGMEINLYIANR